MRKVVHSLFMTPKERRKFLSRLSDLFSPYTGKYHSASLKKLYRQELGSPEALETPILHGETFFQAVPNDPIVHITSGNTLHSSVQSLFYALLIGGRHFFKISEKNASEFFCFLKKIPQEAIQEMEFKTELPQEWIEIAKTFVVYGNSEIISKIQAKRKPHQRCIIYPPKISIACILTPQFKDYASLAKDICLFNQKGCLSTQNIYFNFSKEKRKRLIQKLSEEIKIYLKKNPPSSPTDEEKEALIRIREKYRFLQSNDENNYQILESENLHHWTLIYENCSKINPTPLFRTVFLKPLPQTFLSENFGAFSNEISSISLSPFKKKEIQLFQKWKEIRLCPIGKAQFPSIFWHNSGNSPLKSFITWKNIQ